MTLTKLIDEAQARNDEELKEKKLIKLQEILRRRQWNKDGNIVLDKLQDQIEGAETLEELPMIDPSRNI